MQTKEPKPQRCFLCALLAWCMIATGSKKKRTCSQMSKQLATAGILQNQVQTVVGLESIVELDDEGVADGLEDLPFGHGVLGVLGVHYDRGLLQYLHGIQCVGGDVSHQVDLAVSKID